MYNLLVKNINQNNLQHKIIPHNLGVFCFEGPGKMNSIDLDGGCGVVSNRYNEENHLNCNFGGIGLGNDGENINLTTIDHMKLDNIGYIHCDAQGSENFLFSKGIETITKYKPVILYENIKLYGTYCSNVFIQLKSGMSSIISIPLSDNNCEYLKTKSIILCNVCGPSSIATSNFIFLFIKFCWIKWSSYPFVFVNNVM